MGRPPTNPPPPVPRKRPFQFDVGIAIQIRTLSPAGGCVVVAITRQIPRLSASTIADSMVVFGSATLARLSHVRTGLALAMSGFGGVCISGGSAGPPAGTPPGGEPPRPGCGPWARLAGTSMAAIDAETTSVRYTRFMIVP